MARETIMSRPKKPQETTMSFTLKVPMTEAQRDVLRQAVGDQPMAEWAREVLLNVAKINEGPPEAEPIDVTSLQEIPPGANDTLEATVIPTPTPREEKPPEQLQSIITAIEKIKAMYCSTCFTKWRKKQELPKKCEFCIRKRDTGSEAP